MPPETSETNGREFSPITVKEIVSAINSAPPFQRDEVSKKYGGISVRWHGYLWEARTSYDDKESVDVNLNVSQGFASSHSFWFKEKLTSFPHIQTLPRGAKIEVIGTIASASGPGMSVTLAPLSIRVLATSPAPR